MQRIGQKTEKGWRENPPQTLPQLTTQILLSKYRMGYLNPSPLVVSGSSNSLSRVLCNFPSQYLFAIGLQCVFSFRRNSSPNLHCTLKQCDSAKSTTMDASSCNGAITLYGVVFQQLNRTYHPSRFDTLHLGMAERPPDLVLSCSRFTRSY